VGIHDFVRRNYPRALWGREIKVFPKKEAKVSMVPLISRTDVINDCVAEDMPQSFTPLYVFYLIGYYSGNLDFVLKLVGYRWIYD
jgi:hypothetical protein